MTFAQATPLRKAVIIFLFINLGTFPFFLRNLAPVAYTLTWILSLGACLCTAFFASRIEWQQRVFCGTVWLRLFWFLYTAYLATTMAATAQAVLASGNSQIAKDLATRLSLLLVIAVVAFILTRDDFESILRTYVNLLVLLSIAGSLLVILVFLHQLPMLARVEMPNGSIREFYGLGYVWREIWVGSIFGWERLQSYSDEAGTFAFALLPAILLAFYWRMRTRLAVLCIALLLTFSIGAFVFVLVLGAIKLLSGARSTSRIILLSIFSVSIASVVFLIAENQFARDFARSYLSSKIGETDEKTSTGDRLQDLAAAYSIILKKPFGVGISGYQRSKLAFAIGWLIPAVESGIVGFSFYLAAMLLVLRRSWHIALRGSGIERQLAITIFALAFAAFQRSGMDSTVWHWMWLIAFMKAEETY